MLTVAQPQLGDNSLTRTIKEIALRALSADRGMWSIEASRQRGSLHVNIITPLIDYQPDNRIRMHSSIIEGGARVAAAYCTKQSQCPSSEEYSGKQYGFFGNPVMALAGKGACSELRAYAAEYTAERILLAAADESKTIQEQMQLAEHMRGLRDLLRQ